MDSMSVAELLAALEEFRGKLIEHRELWGKSLSQPTPSFPVKNVQELQAQSDWLTRRLGALRPYIERFDSTWLMHHPATGARWDALDAATGLNAVSQKAKIGMVPNLFSTFAQSSAVLNGYLALSDALGKGVLTARQREIISLAVAQANECHYCLSAHTLGGKGAGLSPEGSASV